MEINLKFLEHSYELHLMCAQSLVAKVLAMKDQF